MLWETGTGAQDASRSKLFRKKPVAQSFLKLVNSGSNTKTFCIGFRSTDPLSTVHKCPVSSYTVEKSLCCVLPRGVSSKRETSRSLTHAVPLKALIQIFGVGAGRLLAWNLLRPELYIDDKYTGQRNSHKKVTI